MKPIVLCILDGVGIRKEKHGNAFLMANTPNFDYLWKTYPHSRLQASGEAVGLPKGQMGNSEVGHMNIGAGRIIYQPLELINQKIEDKTFYENQTILHTTDHVKKSGSKLHIMGLLSDGGVHSHISHLFALIDLCVKENVQNVYFHLFTDGRDTSPNSSLQYISLLQDKIKNLPNYNIASIAGRYYAMDRDNRWDRIQKAYEVITKGINEVENIEEYIKENYEKGITDEFIIPATLQTNGIIEEEDGVIVFNYRPDRLRELLTVLTSDTFKKFEKVDIQNLEVITMMHVNKQVKSKCAFYLEPQVNLLGQTLSEYGLKQLRIAETEKYAHVTYFFDGGEECTLNGEERVLIPSSKVATYEMDPPMRAREITDVVLDCLDKSQYDVIILNYANGDMLGHTGDMEATVQSIEVVDSCLGKLYQMVSDKNGTLLVTADHGNCEYMMNECNEPITSHTTNLVPFIITKKNISLKDGKLGDIAPTILSLLGSPIPKEMTGTNLI